MDLNKLAEIGARTRVEQIQQELMDIYRQFPHVFPHGMPILTGVKERVQVRDKKTAAQKLIDGAERLQRAHGRRKIRKQWKRAQRDTSFTPVDPTGETLLIREAARMAGVTDSGFRNFIVSGLIKALPRTAEDKRLRLKRSDVEELIRKRDEKAHQRQTQLELPAEAANEPAVVNG